MIVKKRKSRSEIEKDNAYLIKDNLRLRKELGLLRADHQKMVELDSKGIEQLSAIVDGVLGYCAEHFGKLTDEGYVLRIEKPDRAKYKVTATIDDIDNNIYTIVADYTDPSVRIKEPQAND